MKANMLPICDNCRQELWDPRSRRHRYYFTRCPDCGPAWGLSGPSRPQREDTPLIDFPMCAECESEVQEVKGRRLGDIACCCPTCGPSLHLLDPRGWPIAGDAAIRAKQLLSEGALLVVKGFHNFAFVALESFPETLARIPKDFQPQVPIPSTIVETAFELLVRTELEAPLVLATLPEEKQTSGINVRQILDEWGELTDAFLVHNLPLK